MPKTSLTTKSPWLLDCDVLSATTLNLLPESNPCPDEKMKVLIPDEEFWILEVTMDGPTLNVYCPVLIVGSPDVLAIAIWFLEGILVIL